MDKLEDCKEIKCDRVGTVTLVAYFSDKFPMENGNCFSMVEVGTDNYYKIINFNHENLEELLKREIIDFPLNVIILGGRTAIMADERIPLDWYSDRFCSVCTPVDYLPTPQKLERLIDIKTGALVETAKYNCLNTGKRVRLEPLPTGPITVLWTITIEEPTDLTSYGYVPTKAIMTKFANKLVNDTKYWGISIDFPTNDEEE